MKCIPIDIFLEEQVITINLDGQEESLKLELREEDFIVDFSIVDVFKIYSGDKFFEGPYSYDPTFEAQIISTKDFTMKEDLTLNKINVSKTSNQSGGNTVYIGGNINESI